MTLTVKCFPMSRRKSISPCVPSHFALSSSSAAVGPAPNSKKRAEPGGRPLGEPGPLQFLQHVRRRHGGESIALLGCSIDGFVDTHFAAFRLPSPPVLYSLVVRSHPTTARDRGHRARVAVRQ